MKTDIKALTDHLFALLEQVSDSTDQDGKPIDEAALRLTLQRAGAGVQIARTLVDVGRLALDAEQLRQEYPDAGVGVLGLGKDRTPRLGRD